MYMYNNKKETAYNAFKHKSIKLHVHCITKYMYMYYITCQTK